MTDRRSVAVWRDDWLPRSETFIREQLLAYRSWTPYKVGLARQPDALMAADFAPLGQGRVDTFRRRLLGTCGLRGLFQEKFSAARVELIHAHFGPCGLTVLPLAESAGLPLIVTFHGRDATSAVSSRHPLRRPYVIRLQRLFRESSTVVAVSAYTAGELRRLGAPAGLIEVLPTGVAVPPIRPQRPPATRDRACITFAGRLVEKKGVDVLLQAVSLLRNPRDVELQVIGNGPERHKLEDMAARLGLSVSFLGWQSPETVRQLIAASTVFCSPSRTARDGDSEGLPTTILEAATTGTPIVASRHAGIPEFVEHGSTGILADENDPRDLARGLTWVLEDAQLAGSLADEAWDKVRSAYNLVVQTAKLEEVYDSVVA